MTINQKKIVEAPYIPPVVENAADAGAQEKVAKIYFSATDIPSIDEIGRAHV